MDDSHVEGDQATFLAPKEQSDPIRHTLSEPDQILSVEHFEAQFRSLIDLPVQRKNLVNLLRSAPIVNLKSYWRLRLEHFEFSAQILSVNFAELFRHELFKAGKIEFKFDSGQTGKALIILSGKDLQQFPIFRREVFQ